ncbi:hypothetical protein KGO95_01135 [Patescibacteria group bacterium]|nr:hypothetical protein [Patescibacteria group bacterium]
MAEQIQLRHGKVSVALYEKMKPVIFELYALGKEKELWAMLDNALGTKHILPQVAAMYLERAGALQRDRTLSAEAKIVIRSILQIEGSQLRLHKDTP